MYKPLGNYTDSALTSLNTVEFIQSYALDNFSIKVFSLH